MTATLEKWLQFPQKILYGKTLNLCCNLYLLCVVIFLFMNSVGDNEIISRVLQGEQQIFAELVNRYRHFVFTIALRYANNREDAEEIAQDVFVKAYRSLADFRSDSKFSTWLYAITTNTCITFRRKRKIITHSLDNGKFFGLVNSSATLN